MVPWWKEEVVYQIYPRSFYDSNGDGIGDLPGIISKLEVLKALGVGIIWLSPVYLSPDRDNGYDIADYKEIQPAYGTMEDMTLLIERAKELGIRIVMDLVINHTSNEHEWFQKSRKSIEPYTDYYIWRDGKKGGLPNNWTSFFAEDCWVYDEVRGQYYLHLFAKEQPDLNYHNPKVIEEIKDIMRFWLDKGIGGFRCDVINVIYKDSLMDGIPKMILTGSEHYISRPGTHKILKELYKEVLSHYDCFTVGETVFVNTKSAKEFVDPQSGELNMLFSFEHMEADHYIVKWFKKPFNRKQFAGTLSKWQREMPWNAHYFENHDQLRSVSRFGNDRRYWLSSAKMLATLLLAMKGTPFLYQGEEIGMTNFDYRSLEDVKDVESHNVNQLLKKWHIPGPIRWAMIKAASRDNCRTPVQWHSGLNGGFSQRSPWIKVNRNHTYINVEDQLTDPESIWSYYKKMIEFRKDNRVLIEGDYREIKVGRYHYVFERSLDDDRLLIIINLSGMVVRAPYQGKIVMSNYDRHKYRGVLKPYEALILKP